uniref:Uncharacterized protein n=1 Tax=Picea glauca TaxID=3330 RepID=A0A117NHK3_PICGL|nr:hypothetical protein ABT39_MTgene4516 [Picea glauca]
MRRRLEAMRDLRRCDMIRKKMSCFALTHEWMSDFVPRPFWSSHLTYLKSNTLRLSLSLDP